MYCKLGQTCVTSWVNFVMLLQIGEASLLQIREQIGQAITNQGNCYYKIGQLLQIEAKYITNWGSYYKLGELLQIGA